jgi:hypothetical protein
LTRCATSSAVQGGEDVKIGGTEMREYGLKRKIADVDSRIANLGRCIAETRSDLESGPNGLAEAALKVYEAIQYKCQAERAELVSKIGRKERRNGK